MKAAGRILLLATALSLVAVAEEGLGSFHYASDLGVAANSDDGVCLAISNPNLQAGRQIDLVVLVPGQTILHAAIMRAAPEACATFANAEAGSNFYYLQLNQGDLAPGAPAIAVVSPVHPLKLRNGVVTSDLNGNGQLEYFRECTSSEGVHLTVWSGKPLRGKLRWHNYYYLGYDTEPSCTAKETVSPKP